VWEYTEDGASLFWEMLSEWKRGNGYELWHWKFCLALRRRVVHNKGGQHQNQDIEVVASPSWEILKV